MSFSGEVVNINMVLLKGWERNREPSVRFLFVFLSLFILLQSDHKEIIISLCI